MVLDPIILEPNRDGFIPSHPRSDLRLSIRSHISLLCTASHSLQTGLQGAAGLSIAGITGTRLASLYEPRWDMGKPATVLVFVPMLPTSTRAAEPLNLEVGVRPSKVCGIDCSFRIKDRDDDRTGMDATLSFRGWNSLNAMATGFHLKVVEIGAGDQ